ncbi:hypothetical protein N9R79_00095 [Vibrio sp.]|nr:hypothetical protein [Vibrio sp.]
MPKATQPSTTKTLTSTTVLASSKILGIDETALEESHIIRMTVIVIALCFIELMS